MKKSKFTEEQIAFALHQADTGTSVEEVCRKLGISQATFYARMKKFGGMGVPEVVDAITMQEDPKLWVRCNQMTGNELGLSWHEQGSL
jgi:putative transposase